MIFGFRIKAPPLHCSLLNSQHHSSIFMASPPTAAAADGGQQNLHFVLFPFMAQGHMVPMMDVATLLAQRGVLVSVVTTPVNAARFEAQIRRRALPIQLFPLDFPCSESGLPDGCESFDLLPSFSLAANFFAASARMEAQAESLLGSLSPPPSCIVADISLPYTATLAGKFGIPRFSFQGFSCICLLTVRLICLHAEEIDASDSDYFSLPGLPDDRIKFTRNQLPMRVRKENREIGVQMLKAESESNGVIMNSFEELETEYVDELKKGEGGNGKIWCVGPVSLTNGDQLDRGGSGGGDSSIVDWLDSKDTRSVIYVCFGSTFNPKPEQLIELGLGLEASNQPFIWVIRENSNRSSGELRNWIEETGFEERIAGRGVLVRGWAPQLAILSHRAVGGFLTHCGWNATIEGICAGVPLITWPLLGDQFVNEKLAVDVLGIGVSLGVEQPVILEWEEVEAAVVKKEDVVRAVQSVVDGGEESEGMRNRATELAVMARRAVESGGSSHENVTRLIEDVKKYQKREMW